MLTAYTLRRKPHGQNLGRSPGGLDPCVHNPPTQGRHVRGSMYTVSLPERKTGFNLGTVRSWPRGAVGTTVSNLDTHSVWVDRGAHAVEFSKTAAPLARGYPSCGTLFPSDRGRAGPRSIAAARASGQNPAGRTTQPTLLRLGLYRTVRRNASSPPQMPCKDTYIKRTRANRRLPNCTTLPSTCARARSSRSPATGSPSIRTPPCPISRRAAELETPNAAASSAGR